MTRISRVMTAGAVLAAGPAQAHADGWLVAEAPVAIANTPSGQLRSGVMPALGLYTDGGALALGVRMRAGVLRAGPGDAGAERIGIGGVALRFTGRGPWIEGVAGAGIAAGQVVPSLEAGVGWAFDVGPVDLGPSAHYVHLAGTSQVASGAAGVLLVGIDVRFGVHQRRSAPPPAEPTAAHVAFAVPPEQAFAVPPEPAIARGAAVVEDSRGAPSEPDADPIVAPIAAPIAAPIVLEQRVLFESERAEVGAQGIADLRAVLQSWSEHPEWRRMTIEGHADVRGPDAYNLALSQRRADRVRALLIDLGADPDRITAVGYGRSRPRDPGTSAAAHRRNRRVEFVIERDAAPDPR